MARGAAGRASICLLGLALLGLLFAPLPAPADSAGSQQSPQSLMGLLQLEAGDLPPGFEVDSEFIPEIGQNTVAEGTSGIIFRRILREGASVILGVNLYVFSTQLEAVAFFEEMLHGEDESVEVAVGERARGKSKEQASPHREGLPASAILFQRDRVVSFLLAGQLDGNANDGAYVKPDEALDFEGLTGIARIQDQKIIEAVAQ